MKSNSPRAEKKKKSLPRDNNSKKHLKHILKDSCQKETHTLLDITEDKIAPDLMTSWMRGITGRNKDLDRRIKKIAIRIDLDK